MARMKTIAVLLTLGTTLAACNGAKGNYRVEANRTLESVNQPVVQRTDYVLDLAAPGGLSAEERTRLHDWFATLGLGYGDRLWVEEPYGATAARYEVARVAAEYGLLVSEGAPITPGTVQPGTVRVIVSRGAASVPGCPNWQQETLVDRSATSSNYGCATNSNLAAMIADPTDLVLGQAGSGTDAKTATKAIKVYREATPTGTQGLISERSGGK